jgi:hypothetical protein
MSGDYLWDRSGEPDPEIQRLEEVLGGLRSNRPAPEFSGQQKVRQIPGRGTRFQGTRWRAAIAAGVALGICASWLVTRPVRVGWQVARMEGTPLVGKSRINGSGQLSVGEWLETDAGSRARISVSDIGQVDLEPNSRLRLVRARSTGHRLALVRGEMQAMIWAPPRMFSVETPAAVAVDLGCRYSLKVDDAGITTLHVTLGWVGFEQNGHESWVPAGAECVTRPGRQTGTPYFVDASETFRAALAKFDFEHDAAALNSVLAEARNRDAVTLWHLLPMVQAADRVRVYDRLAQLAPPPDSVTREAVLAADKQALDLWWDQLGLGESSFWRMWKGPSPFQGK